MEPRPAPADRLRRDLYSLRHLSTSTGSTVEDLYIEELVVRTARSMYKDRQYEQPDRKLRHPRAVSVNRSNRRDYLPFHPSCTPGCTVIQDR